MLPQLETAGVVAIVVAAVAIDNRLLWSLHGNDNQLHYLILKHRAPLLRLHQRQKTSMFG